MAPPLHRQHRRRRRPAARSPSDGVGRWPAGCSCRPVTPSGALLVCHGAGSRKENHELMGEQAAAAGLAALTFDFRGHGESGGVMGPDGWRDVAAAGERLLRRPARRGSRRAGPAWAAAWLLLAARARPDCSARSCCSAPPTARRCSPASTELERDPAAAPSDPQGREYSAASTPPPCAPYPRATSTSSPRRAACRACCSRTRATTTPCPSRTASGSRPCWRRPRGSSRSTRAAITVRAVRRRWPGRRSTGLLAHGTAGRSRPGRRRATPSGAEQRQQRATMPPTSSASTMVPAQMSAVRRQPSSRPSTAIVATQGM